jgi:hypothetical protein
VVESGDHPVLIDIADGEALSRIEPFMTKSSISKDRPIVERPVIALDPNEQGISPVMPIHYLKL